MNILVYIQIGMFSLSVSFAPASPRPLHWIKLMGIYSCFSPRVFSLYKLVFQLLFCYFLIKAFTWHLQKFLVLPVLNEHWFGCHQQNLQWYEVCKHNLKQPRHFHSDGSVTRSILRCPKCIEKTRSNLNLCRYLSVMRLCGNNGETQHNQLGKCLPSMVFCLSLKETSEGTT